MLETEHGIFDMIKNYRDAFVLDDFNQRYIDYFNQYRFIVGDYSAGILRLKGFSEENQSLIPDYIVESCAPNCAYFILKNDHTSKGEEQE
jgi:uncharacterized protein YutD